MELWGNTYWPVGLVVVAVMFIAPESYALLTNSANTLSDYCWRELSVSVAFGHGRHTVAWWASLIGWGLFVGVITAHIWWRAA